jgi:hypothetical protein
MLKKNEVLDVLERGGYIGKDSIYWSARVYDIDGEFIDTCRYDTAEKIAKMDGYRVKKQDNWSFYQVIAKDWDAAAQRVQEATEKAIAAFENAGITQNAKIESIQEEKKTMRKEYANLTNGNITTKVTEALQWHRDGHKIQVDTFDANNAITRTVRIIGAQQENRQAKQDADNWRHCRRIANDLEDYYNGSVRVCPGCGEIHCRDWDDVGDVFKCPRCGAVTDTDEWEQQSLWDYFNDCYDIEYRIGSDKQLRSVQIMVTCGGPNIYIDTASRQVELYWWGDRASYAIDSDICNDIDSIFEELYRC